MFCLYGFRPILPTNETPKMENFSISDHKKEKQQCLIKRLLLLECKFDLDGLENRMLQAFKGKAVSAKKGTIL